MIYNICNSFFKNIKIQYLKTATDFCLPKKKNDNQFDLYTYTFKSGYFSAIQLLVRE